MRESVLRLRRGTVTHDIGSILAVKWFIRVAAIPQQ
jgi:hypothetical protein